VRLGVLGAVFSAATLLGWWAAPEAPLWRMLTDPTLFEFLAGCGLAVLWRRGVRWGRGVCLGLVILGVGLLLAQWSRLPPGDVRLLGWGVPAVLVVAGCLLPDRPLRWRGLSVLTALGDRSYSLYLSHFFALALFVRLHRAAPLPDGLALLAMVALCLVVADLCWRSIERPAQRHFARRSPG
jgi:peptidoglycan/LPS O-acetylase OafA/YrhL